MYADAASAGPDAMFRQATESRRIPGEKLRFFIARLRSASFPEIVYRLRLAAIVCMTRFRVKRGIPVVRTPEGDSALLRLLKVPRIFATPDVNTSLRFPNADFGQISAVEDRLIQKFCCDIPINSADYDIRALWEPARLQQFMPLLVRMAMKQPGDDPDQYSLLVRDGLMAWLRRNPFLLGPHYLSAMECGLRIPVFFYALKVLDALSREERSELFSALYSHAWWIEKRLSLYSSLGNHTVCEAVGLLFAGALFRNTFTGKRWLDRSIALLDQEVEHQILSDGGPAEQSFAYHRFVLDLYWLAVDFLESNNIHSCSTITARLMTGELFLAACTDESGRMPAIGDSDDGHAIAPGFAPQRIEAADRRDRCRIFPTSGYSAVRFGNGIHLLFDHGPLGMSPLYNHGHADALSITLSIGGVPVLVDPGTYRYNGAPDFRRYFKGTRAHNTITVDRQDQAVQETGFIWSRPYAATLVRHGMTATGIFLEGTHDGYLRLEGAVRHFRRVECNDDGRVEITDHFLGSGQHTFELNFHLHPDAMVLEQERLWMVERDGRSIRIELKHGGFQLRRGEENPPLGWFSPGYDEKAPSPVLQAVRSGAPTEVRFETLITVI